MYEKEEQREKTSEAEMEAGELSVFEYAETVLRRERDFMATVQDAISSLVVVINRNGRIERFNKACEKLTGYTFEEVSGRFVWDLFIVPEEVERVKGVFNELRAGNFPNTHENYWLTKDGQRRWITWSNTAFLDDRGQVNYVIATGIDITDRTNAETALQVALKKAEDEKSKADSILEAIGDAISIQDTDFRVLYQNKVHQDLVGDRVREYCYVAYEGRDHVCEGCPVNMSFRDAGIHTVERMAVTERGAVQVEVTSSPLRDSSGKIIAGIEVVRDITDRKHAEEKLRRNYDTQYSLNELLKISLENDSLDTILERALDIILAIPWLVLESKGVIFLVDEQGTALTMKAHKGVNPAAQVKCAIVPFGQCLCGRAAAGQDVLYAGGADERHEIVLDGESDHGHYCVPILFAGTTLGVMTLYLHEGHPQDPGEVEFLYAFANTLAGIIRRKQTEDQAAAVKEQLFQSQKMEAVGIMAGGIAHDFNNILTAILGNAELSIMRISRSDPFYRNVEQIQMAATRAAQLTQQLLLFSRKQPMQLSPVAINPTIEHLLLMLRRLIGEDIEIHLELQPDLRPVMADQGRIEQILLNLSINARDAMPAGGCITIRTENVIVGEKMNSGIHNTQAGEYVRLSVNDTGTGINKSILGRIFEPFYTTKEYGKGTGLGLSVIDDIARDHGGWIDVHSEEGHGSRFQIYIPALTQGIVEKQCDDIPLSLLRGKGERILLVEDERMVRELTEKILAENGYAVFASCDVSDAISIFEREGGNFDILVTDVVMPGGNGLQLIETLLSRKPGLRIVLTSGYTDEKSQMALIREYKYAFLQKPYAVSSLLRMVKKTLGS